MLSRKFNFITPGEMYYKYYQSNTLRIVVLIIGLFFCCSISWYNYSSNCF
jgi:Na+/proline symporter